MKIVNLTQHAASADQVSAGVVELPQEQIAAVRNLLTFDAPPSSVEMLARAREIARIAKESGADAAMIGGAPYFMGRLEDALRRVGVKPLYAFSVRESVDAPHPDGAVRKVAVFRHAGWVGL